MGYSPACQILLLPPVDAAAQSPGTGTRTRVVGVDPRREVPVEHGADDASSTERTSLGKRTDLVDCNTGGAP